MNSNLETHATGPQGFVVRAGAGIGAAAPLATYAWRTAGVIGFALLTALSAHVAIPLPDTPVPITLQTLTVLVAGAVLGPRYGLLSMALYVGLGSAGYHVFAGGSWGFQTVAGATGGYLLGFLAAQPLVGGLTRPAARGGWAVTLAALLLGHAVIFACGLAWLQAWSGGPWARTLAWGLLPFVPGTFIKTALALGIVRLVAPRVRPRFD